METIYDVDYFIAKFSAIPESEIGSHSLKNQCAYWHCGLKDSLSENDEAVAFGNLMAKFDNKYDNVNAYAEGLHWGAVWINDGSAKGYNQPTPKQRILAALYDIKKMQEPKPTYENISKSLAILPINETSDKTSTPKPLNELV